MEEPVRFVKLNRDEHHLTLEKSKIRALFVEVEGVYGLMVEGEGPNHLLSRAEKIALIRAARAVPTRD
jgi:hypothetical protein